MKFKKMKPKVIAILISMIDGPFDEICECYKTNPRMKSIKYKDSKTFKFWSIQEALLFE
jgi:hypothetical protein